MPRRNPEQPAALRRHYRCRPAAAILLETNGRPKRPRLLGQIAVLLRAQSSRRRARPCRSSPSRALYERVESPPRLRALARAVRHRRRSCCSAAAVTRQRVIAKGLRVVASFVESVNLFADGRGEFAFGRWLTRSNRTSARSRARRDTILRRLRHGRRQEGPGFSGTSFNLSTIRQSSGTDEALTLRIMLLR